MDVDSWLETVDKCDYLPEPSMVSLCRQVSSILLEEPNIVPLESPVTLCGDVHGQFYDVQELFRVAGRPPNIRIVFIGDFVDRGYYSLETLTQLLALKLKFSDRVTLLRGNHESRQTTQVYGFYDECMQKYGNGNVWRWSCRVFDLLPIAALVDREAFCVHGGLSPYAKTLNSISCIDRNMELPLSGPFSDILWSDPDDCDGWALNSRGAGWLFGRSALERFLHANHSRLVCRAHQLVQEGYAYRWDEKIVTIWSAPNYCYRAGNVAAVMTINSLENRYFKIFDAVRDDKRKVPLRNASPYFL